MFIIKTVKKITVTEQIMEQIARLITTGQIQAGQQLPNERDLAQQFGVTRGRVREALRALSLVGLIVIKAGEGSFVKNQDIPISADTIVWMFHHEMHNLNEVFEARKLIESEVYLTAVEQTTEADMNKLSMIINKLTNDLKPENPASFLNTLDQFDLFIGEICGNRIYAKLMQTIVYLRRETSLKLLSVPGSMENSIKIRSSLLQALQAKDKKQMRKATQDFFQQARAFYDNIGNRKEFKI